ncbi:hypothetical protein Q4667_004457 [Salmonella enterica]|nr:hypothetical protein [Salmonella enterica]ELF3803921.1 hypothetical protein [Salmonella enterica]ELF3806605.1 hypothetical protein [Salmonella enterica]ELL5148332.1 hypothetical protein [Salmonella enterica]ELL5151608.1 hypothetical protein [Salmonella enterica]
MDEKMGNMTSVSTSPRIPLTKLDLPGKAAMSIVATTMFTLNIIRGVYAANGDSPVMVVTLSIVSVLQLIAGITCDYEGYKAMFSHMAPYMRLWRHKYSVNNRLPPSWNFPRHFKVSQIGRKHPGSIKQNKYLCFQDTLGHGLL